MSKLKKDVASIKETLENLTKPYVARAKRLDEVEEYLKNIHFNVKMCNLKLMENGSYGVEVYYDIPKIVLEFDDNGEIVKNDMFVAINMLNLITLDDMEKISMKIIDAKKF